jgi:hypothetical protein
MNEFLVQRISLVGDSLQRFAHGHRLASDEGKLPGNGTPWAPRTYLLFDRYAGAIPKKYSARLAMTSRPLKTCLAGC